MRAVRRADVGTESNSYVRKDGSRQRRYICANVHGESGCCDMPAIDADKLDTAVPQTLRELILDFERFLRAALESHEHRLVALDREIAAALEQLDQFDKDIGLLEADYRRRLRDGSEVAVDLVVRSLESTHQQRKSCESRVASWRRDRADVARETPHDRALDAYNDMRPTYTRIEQALSASPRLDGARGLRDALHRLEDPDVTRRANEELRAAFVAFRLNVPRREWSPESPSIR